MSIPSFKSKTESESFILADGQRLGLSENSIRVLMNRYLKKGPEGWCTETPEQLFRRVAFHIAQAMYSYQGTAEDVAKEEEAYFSMMCSGKFLPNSPTLMNAGREMGMLSACFVLPIEDCVEGIFDTIKATAMIQKAGGGTGFSFDRLRPTGDYIKSSGGTTSGPISFWKVLSEATNAIQQGAFRRGANMGMMTITHPDILKFIFAKQDLSRFQNYNISVKVTDEWMEEFEKAPSSPLIVTNYRAKKDYVIPRDISVEHYQISDLIPYDVYTTTNNMAIANRAAVWSKEEVWNTIVKNAWQTGEPGVVFIDKINAFNPTPNVGQMEATNPCGEQPLLPFEACNLGSVNLGLFVGCPDDLPGHPSYDWEGLRETIHLSTRFLENVVDVNNYVIPQIAKICTENRKIGLGIMGFSDALYKLGIGYNTHEGVEWGERFMKFVNDEAHNESERLAEVRGVFKNWHGSRWEHQWQRKQRNACSTTVAPTGTISIIADCSGGVEPLFSLAFTRQVMKNHKGEPVRMTEVNEIFSKVAKEANYWGYDKVTLFERIATEGTIKYIDNIPEGVKKVFVSAHDISPEWHIQMQAAFQRHCDSSISKTTNFPNSATPQDVDAIYRLAYKSGCKGVTVYRDGCREMQPMALKKEEKKIVALEKVPIKPIRTPSILSAVRLRTKTPFGHMHVTISVDPKTEQELEVFAQVGKAGDVVTSDVEAICRLISLWLRANGEMAYIIDQLEGIGSCLSIPTRDGQVQSVGDALAKALRKYMNAKHLAGLKAILMGDVDVESLSSGDEAVRVSKSVDTLLNQVKVKCPQCHVGILAFQEGCKKCNGCGYSQC